MVASHAGCHPSTPEGGIGTRVGQALGPRAPPIVNKPRPGDADAPVINGLLPGLLTVITACVFAGNVVFQNYSLTRDTVKVSLEGSYTIT